MHLLIIMEILNFDAPMSQMQLNDFLPSSRRHGGDRAPVLLQYRSSRWFILTTVSVAIFTVGKHSSHADKLHSQFSSGRFSVRYHRSCCPVRIAPESKRQQQ